MPRWGMVIDLQKCIGCGSCVVGCKEKNMVPKNSWKKVYDCGVTPAPERHRLFLHLSCMHCDDPPCLSVCPSGATYRRGDGIIGIDYTRCAGCGYCIVACPYQARKIYPGEHDFEINDKAGDYGKLSVPDRSGVCTKCDFCMQRIDAGLSMGLNPGIDSEASPVCMLSCSAGVISFGDLDDPGAAVSKLLKENRTSRLQEELNTGPAIFFIKT
jgi:phenylacetyl-CoA:acceptor oxidoreductase 27-kDa subunit